MFIRKSQSRAIQWIAVVILAGLIASRAGAQEARFHFDISNVSLSQALRSYGQISGQEIIFTEDVVAGLKSISLQGDYTAQAALDRLLQGTGLIARRSSSGAVMIRRPDSTGALASKQGDDPDPPSDSSTGREGEKGSSAGSRVAQVDPGKAQSTASVEGQNEGSAKEKEEKRREQLQEVVVTGTHIHDSTNPTAPMIVIDRAEIERSGYTTTQELAASIPQNFGGGSAGATEDGLLGGGYYKFNNLSFGTGINLRGLGGSSTLVLVNGERVAAADKGTFVDVSMIPLGAIDRVEVMTDGASAIYGADAVAGVVNFVLRKDYDGQETSASYGSGTDGTVPQSLIAQTVGRDWSGGNAVAGLQYQRQGALNAMDRAYTDSAPPPTDLLPKSERYSAFLNSRQDLPAGFEVGSGVLYSYSDLHDYINTVSSIIESAPITNQGVATVSLGYQPADQWHIKASGSFSLWNVTAPQLYAPPNSSQSDHLHENYKEDSADIIADGTLFRTAGGDVKAAFGGAYRNDMYTEFFVELPQFSTRDDRHMFSEFAELELPIVGAANGSPFLRALDLSLAVRHDDYSDFGGTTNPRYGVAWKPVDGVRIRGAYSTSFRAPTTIEEITANLPKTLYSLQWPSPTGGTVPILFQNQGGPPLEPEKSRNLTGGFDYQPSVHPGLKVSVDYFNIRYENRIELPNLLGDASALSKLNVYGSLISPLPSDAAAEAYIAQITSEGGTFTDLGGGAGPGIRYLFNGYLLNAALVKTSGLDITSNYTVSVRGNDFRAAVNVAYLDQILTSYTATSTPTNVVNTYGNPLHWRARGILGWNRGPWGINTALNFSGHYVDTTTLGNPPISSWTTMDVQLTYTPTWIDSRLRLSLSGTNIFDKPPPYVAGASQLTDVLGNNAIHYDVGNANPFGRVIVLGARLAW